VDTIKVSRHKSMKELRPGSTGRSELRILFVFDPKRQAIPLIAGDKFDNWIRWYKRDIPIADDLFDEHSKAERKVATTPMTITELLEEHPVDREEVDTHEEQMLTEIRAYRLREQTGLTQAQLADRIGVGQCRVSKIERGDLEEDSKIGTIRLYLEAVGGHLSIEYVTDDQRIQVLVPNHTSRRRLQFVQAVSRS